MIWINLIGAGRGDAARSVRPHRSVADRVATGVAVLALGTSVALVASRAWSLHQTATTVTRALAAASADRHVRGSADARADTEEQRRAGLARRVAELARWRATRRASVLFLGTVSRSLPDGIWLVGVQQDARTFVLSGHTTRSEAVFEFAVNLEASGRVVLPVEVVGADADGDGTFALRAELLPPVTDTGEQLAREE